jgi:hypothetical protein
MGSKFDLSFTSQDNCQLCLKATCQGEYLGQKEKIKDKRETPNGLTLAVAL